MMITIPKTSPSPTPFIHVDEAPHAAGHSAHHSQRAIIGGLPDDFPIRSHDEASLAVARELPES